MVEIHCLLCSKLIRTYPSRIGRKNYCSRSCSSKNNTKAFLAMHEARRGKPAWNKGQPMSEEMKRKMSEFRTGRRLGEENPAWIGEKIGYRSLHAYIEKNLGKPDKCQNCKKEGLKGHLIHWANISGEYKRDFNDWIRLCALCHGQQGHSGVIKKRFHSSV